jgi:hypothetical protein
VVTGYCVLPPRVAKTPPGYGRSARKWIGDDRAMGSFSDARQASSGNESEERD